MVAALLPGGANGDLCTSLPEETGTGAFGGHKLCTATPQDFDRSNQYLDSVCQHRLRLGSVLNLTNCSHFNHSRKFI